MEISIKQQIMEAKREVALRERVYPKWIGTGRVTQGQADRQLTAMKAILATLEALERDQQTRIQPTLFGD